MAPPTDVIASFAVKTAKVLPQFPMESDATAGDVPKVLWVVLGVTVVAVVVVMFVGGVSTSACRAST
jgi:hypothetical protein